MKKTLAIAIVAAAASSAVQAAETYKIDPAHTNARFAIGHFGTSTNHGGFYNLTGDIKVDSKNNTGELQVVIPVDSINTGNDQFNDHLKSSDLFDAEKFPAMTFTSTKWNIADGKLQSITGNLELLGKTNPVTLDATQFNCYESPMFDGATVCGGDFETVIDRTQWGMNYLVEYGMPKDVKLSIQVEAVKQ